MERYTCIRPDAPFLLGRCAVTTENQAEFQVLFFFAVYLSTNWHRAKLKYALVHVGMMHSSFSMFIDEKERNQQVEEKGFFVLL